MSDDAATGDGAREATPEERRALFRVVRGTPSDAELAALTVVLAAAARRRAPGADLLGVDRPGGPDAAAAAAGPGAWHNLGLAALTPAAQMLVNSLSPTVPRPQSRYRQRAARGRAT